MYGDKIAEDFKKGKLDEDGNPLEPSEYEKLTPEEAYMMARRTGSDYFCQDTPVLPDHEEHNFVGDHKISNKVLKDDFTHEHEDRLADRTWVDTNINNI